MFSCRSPIRALTRRLMIGSCIPVRMTMVHGVLSTNSTLIQLHNQLPYNRTNNVTRWKLQNGSSWPARFSLMNCRRLTILSLAQCHVCQHWHKPIIPSRSLPQPGVPFSEAMINHFQKIQQELQTLRWATHTNLLRYFAPERPCTLC